MNFDQIVPFPGEQEIGGAMKEYFYASLKLLDRCCPNADYVLWTAPNYLVPGMLSPVAFVQLEGRAVVLAAGPSEKTVQLFHPQRGRGVCFHSDRGKLIGQCKAIFEEDPFNERGFYRTQAYDVYVASTVLNAAKQLAEDAGISLGVAFWELEYMGQSMTFGRHHLEPWDLERPAVYIGTLQPQKKMDDMRARLQPKLDTEKS